MDFWCERSCYVFGPRSRIRRLCMRLIADPWFDRFVLLLIIANSFILAIQNHRAGTEAWEYQLLNDTELGFLTLFGLELVVKVIAMGFCMDPRSYLRDEWNWLDMVVVVSGVLMIALRDQTEDRGLSFLRAFRVLRPLRSMA